MQAYKRMSKAATLALFASGVMGVNSIAPATPLQSARVYSQQERKSIQKEYVNTTIIGARSITPDERTS